jgi:hypothetical protein
MRHGRSLSNLRARRLALVGASVCALLVPPLVGRGVLAASGEPLVRLRDTVTTHEWVYSSGLGGGMTRVLGPEDPNDPRSSFLEGAGIRLRLGCDGFDPARSRWEFHVHVTAPRTGLTGDEERAFDAGSRVLLSAPGRLVLFDERDEPVRHFALVPTNGALIVEAFRPEHVRDFMDASRLVIETPSLRLETGMIGIFPGDESLRTKFACRRDAPAARHHTDRD